ncbi:hypothetical protein RYZ59_14515 [Citrobacter sp. HN-141]|uniref:hypothetical protein n=1 Tax=unclassified Citrobacter TaxID=2644389 RepID=UPI00296543F7|nr:MULTISPECIES: hypothetical protein [unclassified Citrobacter]MDW2644781.1 hypothetical protein [Citrobacter sp. HN-141]MDW2654487.1 hypothetical protein [Citrobacter sp. HN-120]MDW2697356.1 hypothetical protein [Citrobacter sp. HN-144]
MNYELFLNLCDKLVTNITLPQIDSKDGYVKIKSISGDNIYLIREKLIYLQKKIVYEHIVNGRPLNPYMSYVCTLIDGSRDNTKNKEQGKASTIKWDEIISVLGEIKDTNSLMSEDEHFEITYAKYFDFSRSCVRLIKNGFPIIEIEDSFYFDSNYHHQLSIEIGRLATSIGGCNILHAVFESISNSYDSSQKRFHIHRSLSMGHDRPLPAIPWAYLIALGTKYSNSFGDSNRENNFPKLINLLTDIVAVFEVQDYSPYESWYVDHYGLTKFLSDEVVFDNLYCIAQMHSGHVTEILNYVVNSSEFKSLKSHGFSIGKIYKSGLTLLSKTLDHQITHIDHNNIKKILNLDPKKNTAIINNILLNKSPNHSLEFPPKSTNIDNNFNILTPLKSSYLLLPRPLSSLAFLNNTLNSIIAPDGKRNKHNDATLGHVIERFVKDKLLSYGILFHSGNFVSKDGLVYGESDITIETDNTIIFIEIKKKGMTRLSMSGVDYSILSDLGGGLIHATSQCFKAERVLRCDGKINIEGSSPIIYKSQRVIKIALTLYDYGSFQDRMTIRSILTNSLGATFKGANSSIDKKLNNWKEHINELSTHIQCLKDSNQLDAEPFHNLFFMSISQLLMILEDKGSSEGLVKALITLSSISHSTRDFYKEYSLSKKYIKA